MIVTGVAGEPTTNDAGVTPVITGTGGTLVKVAGADTPPPGGGFATVIFASPAVARSAAVNAMVSWVALCTVVVRALPAKEAVELWTKPVPVTTTFVAPLPAVTDAGESEVIFGTAFTGGG